MQSHRGVVRNEVFGVSVREEKVRLQCGGEKRRGEGKVREERKRKAEQRRAERGREERRKTKMTAEKD